MIRLFSRNFSHAFSSLSTRSTPRLQPRRRRARREKASHSSPPRYLREPIIAHSRLHPVRPAPDRHDAGARDLDQAEREHERDEALDFVARAGNLEHEALSRSIDDPGAKRVREPQRLHAVLALAAHLDHRELALDMWPGHRHVD